MKKERERERVDNHDDKSRTFSTQEKLDLGVEKSRIIISKNGEEKQIVRTDNEKVRGKKLFI